MESNERGLNSEIERLKQAPLPDAAPKVVAPPLTVSVDGPAERKVFELRRVDTSFTSATRKACGGISQKILPWSTKPAAKSEAGSEAGPIPFSPCQALLACFKPPAAAAVAVEPDYDGCYLLFTEARGGSFIAHWSQTELPEGSEPLAYYKPSTPVAKFKYAGGGQTEMCRGVGGPNKKLFYQGWASFLRAAYGQRGTLTFLRNVDACPVAIFLCKSDTSVLRLQMGKPLQLGAGIAAVAVTPPLATGLDVHTMPTRIFNAVGDKAGAAFSLDGGGDGKAEDVAESLSRSRSLSASTPRGSPRRDSEGGSPVGSPSPNNPFPK